MTPHGKAHDNSHSPPSRQEVENKFNHTFRASATVLSCVPKTHISIPVPKVNSCRTFIVPKASRPALAGQRDTGRTRDGAVANQKTIGNGSSIIRGAHMIEAIRLTAYDVAFAAVSSLMAGAPFVVVILLFG